MPTAGLVAHTLVARFVDHLPYFRQEQINARSGVHTPRSTLAAWAGAGGASLMPLYEAHRKLNRTPKCGHYDLREALSTAGRPLRCGAARAKAPEPRGVRQRSRQLLQRARRHPRASAGRREHGAPRTHPRERQAHWRTRCCRVASSVRCCPGTATVPGRQQDATRRPRGCCPATRWPHVRWACTSRSPMEGGPVVSRIALPRQINAIRS